MNLYSLIFLLTIASFTPGPNNLLASYSGLNFGFKRTLPLIHGVALGWGSLLILLCAGLIIIFQKYNFLQLYLKIFGSIFLLYMSYKIAINSSLDKIGTSKKHSETFKRTSSRLHEMTMSKYS